MVKVDKTSKQVWPVLKHFTGSRDFARLEHVWMLPASLGCSSSLRILHCLLLPCPLSSTIRRHRNIGIRAANHPLDIDSVHCRNEIPRTPTVSPGPTFLIHPPPQGDHTCPPAS